MIDNPLTKYLRSTILNEYGGHAAIGISCLSIVCKEALFLHTLKIGKAIGSSSITANPLDILTL